MRRIAIAVVFSCWTALIGLACRPLPEPETPPAPTPEPVPPPNPDAGPAATDCQRACAKADALDCDGNGQPDPQCPEACERYEHVGGELARNPACQAKATTCAEHAACRSGSP